MKDVTWVKYSLLEAYFTSGKSSKRYSAQFISLSLGGDLKVTLSDL